MGASTAAAAREARRRNSRRHGPGWESELTVGLFIAPFLPASAYMCGQANWRVPLAQSSMSENSNDRQKQQQRRNFSREAEIDVKL